MITALTSVFSDCMLFRHSIVFCSFFLFLFVQRNLIVHFQQGKGCDVKFLAGTYVIEILTSFKIYTIDSCYNSKNSQQKRKKGKLTKTIVTNKNKVQ